jgi:hypothetical protein
METTKSVIQKRWLTPEDFFLEFDFSISRQAYLRMKRLIPYSKIGRYIRYDRIEIDKWFSDHKVV